MSLFTVATTNAQWGLESLELIESELFGQVKGSFTGAAKDHTGLFEQAQCNTLILDEIGECDLGLQAKLLRALQPPDNGDPYQRVFRPVGATEDRTADVRKNPKKQRVQF